MLMFFGKPKGSDHDIDENASRAARLERLRKEFYAWKQWSEFAPQNASFAPVAIQYLLNQIKDGSTKRLTDYGDAAKVLVLNAHGSSRTFNGYDGSEVAQMLVTLGIKEAGTREVWVAACNVGQQTQDNSSPEPFACDLLRALRIQHEIDVKVYAPRGKIRYTNKTLQPVGNQSILSYGGADIPTKERIYAFSEGWVLAQ